MSASEDGGINYNDVLEGSAASSSNKVVTIRLNNKAGGQETKLVDEVETTPMPLSKTRRPMARVGYASGTTINLGNYESVRLDVSISIPCEIEDIDEAFDTCVQFVGEKSTQLLEDNNLDRKD